VTDTIEVGKPAYLNEDQYVATVIRKERDAKRPGYRREPWRSAALLWGDCVFVRSINGEMAEVSAKGHRLEVPVRKLTPRGILSLWQIDCGQGDAALLRFPDNKWAMVDLGPPRSGVISTNSGRTAIDFLKWIAFQDNNWRFEDDNADDPFHLEWVVISHPDEDHFGAGKEMLNRIGSWWSMDTVYHCGLGRYKGAPARKYRPASGGQGRQPGFSQLGVVDGKSSRKLYLTSLFDHFGDVGRLQKTTANRDWTLTGTSYANFIGGLHERRGQGVRKLKRLSHRSDGSALGSGGVTFKVLGPVEEDDPIDGRPALRYLDRNSTSSRRPYSLQSPSLSRNGQSVVLRMDYGDVRIMLTGDLNFKSQALIQNHWDDEEFRCDVAKACHHGSEDISWRFMQKMSPVATMFSSGDQETHVHPRALVLGMCGALSPLMKRRTKDSPSSGPDQRFEERKFAGFAEEKIFAPLLYSTELSRSTSLRSDMKPYSRSKNEEDDWEYSALKGVYLKGGRKKDKYVHLGRVRIADALTYGLINVRTDGEKVLMAVMEEGNQSNPQFHVETFWPKDLVRVE
jgi:beta-lactamase superfamily II metal-dependent hydrolase